MDLIAHRGASGYCPENTMAAFKKAVEINVASIELDIHLSKDGIPVICHDAKIKRTSNGEGFVNDFTLAELKQYDFGSWYDKKFTGERIPTLEEVLQYLKDKEQTINIEIKSGKIVYTGIEQKMLDLVYQYGLQDRIWVTSFNHESLQKVAQLDKNIKIGFILHTNLIDVFNYIDHSGIEPYSIHPNYYYITEEMVTEAHNRGYKVVACTLDDPVIGEKYYKMGIDAMLTNRPIGYQESELSR